MWEDVIEDEHLTLNRYSFGRQKSNNDDEGVRERDNRREC